MLVKRCGEWTAGDDKGWYLEVQRRAAEQPRYCAVSRGWLEQVPTRTFLRLWQGHQCFLALRNPPLYSSLDAIPLPPPRR